MNNTNLLKTGFVNERFRYYEKLVAELTMMSVHAERVKYSGMCGICIKSYY